MDKQERAVQCGYYLPSLVNVIYSFFLICENLPK